MKKTLMRMLTLMLLMMFSMGAMADVKVLFGEKGQELQPGKDGSITLSQKEITGGTIVITQEDLKDGTFKVVLSVTPDKGYSMAKDGPEVYAVAPADISQTRTVKASTKLDIKSEDFKDEASKRTYTATIDSNLALWLKNVAFNPSSSKDGGTRGTINFNKPDGYYYLGNQAGVNNVPAYDGDSFESNYYMCPAYSATVNVNNYLGGDVDKPLITTFKSFSDNALNQGKTYSWAVWYIEAATGDNADYFYIKHRDSGKFLIANDNSDPKASRRRVNLGPTSNPGDDCLFKIQSDNNGSTYYISSKTKKDGTNVYVNPSKANLDYLAATSDNDNTGGILGFWNEKTGNSAWHFVLVPTEKPTITYDNTTKEVTMVSATVGATIYYTTDGSNPDKDNVGGNNPTQQYNPDSKPAFSVPTTIKAIAIADKYDVSEVQSFSIQKVETPTTFTSSTGLLVLSSVTPYSVIYYTIGDTEPEDPTTSSNQYTAPLENVSGKYIKAIAVKNGLIDSDVLSTGKIKLQCATPVITRVGLTFTLSCSFPSDVTLYYSINGGSKETYNGTPVPFTADQLPMTVTAFASHNDYDQSETASMVLKNGEGTSDDPYLIYSTSDFSNFVNNVNNGTTVSACYKLGSDISASGVDAITNTFKGTFDGDLYIITDLTHPLFNTIDGGVVKNVILKDVTISQSGNVGAITCTASGYTRIYNCGILPSSNKFVSETSVISSSDGYCGGLVGELNDDSRVVNCFSYAKISGGTVKAGIVGYNQTASTTAVTNGKYEKLKTMVVNCMFYGDITGSTGSVYPVYGGSKILNTGNNGINNYNYYRAEASITPTDYNCSWPASEENLTRFEYYRYLLNSNRALCGWWVGAPSAPSTMPTADVQAVDKDASLMAKWVLDPSIAPYPILKSAGTYPSVINIDPVRRIDPDTKAWVTRSPSTNNIQTNASPDIHGETLGSISVSIDAGSHHSGNANVSRSITITAMDIDNNDFCYGKIQLPYYNEIFGNPDGTTWSEKYGDNYTDMVVTGWDITTSEGTAGTFSEDPIEGYNFADRYCTAKDTHRTFAQGGFYYVPYGVTSITITAHWAKAYYLSNTGGNYERVYFSENNSNKTSAGQPFAPAGTRSFGSGEFGGQTINNGTIASILTNSNTGKENSVYDCAIVLVSNYQYRNNTNNIAENDRKPFTLMTVDLDFDNEPDYCFEWQFGGGTGGTTRAYVNPVRFDFLPIVELGIAMKENESKYLFTIGKVTPYGHFEITETALIHMGQFEYDDKNRAITGPVILNNGLFDQICRGSDSDNDQNVNYFILGGHVKMPSFTPGSHVRTAVKSRHCAVNVLGGEIANFYLSGNYIATPTNEGNPHCYIDGGKLDFVASGAKEQIVGDVFWKIDHANIGEFYGGGINANKPVKGSIDITINRSKVTKFCGGPQFGDMESGKTVTTNATGTTFGVFYGAGNGGTCYSQYEQTDATSSNPNSHDWETVTNNNTTGNLKNYTALKYRNKATGYHAKYELEMINSSAGTMNNAVCRTYMYSAQFATTNTGHVTSTLTDCTIEGNFFGGGLLGGVNGNVTSTLMGNTVVQGNAYGAGYGVADLTVDVLPKGYTPPKRDANTAVITAPQYPDATTYYWTHATTFGSTTLSTSSPVILNPNGDGKNYLYTEIALDDLGKISGNVTFTIKGNTRVEGNVYGGGDRGVVKGSTTVNIED